MALDPYQMGYFITQVGLSAASFGVAKSDITAVATALTKLFDYRCSPPTTVVKEQGPQLQAMCIADNCPLSPEATCAAYEKVEEPAVANATLAMGLGSNSTVSGNSTMTGSATGTSGAMVPTATSSMTPIQTGGAAKVGGGLVAGGAALLALML